MSRRLILTFAVLFSLVGKTGELADSRSAPAKSPAGEVSACRAHDPRFQDVPLCPEGEATNLSATYPAMAYIIQANSKYISKEETWKLVSSALEGQADRPPLIILDIAESDFNYLKSQVAAIKNESKRKIWEDTIQRTPKQSDGSFPQDYFLTSVGKDGFPKVRPLSRLLSMKDESFYSSVFKSLKAYCGIEMGQPFSREIKDEQDWNRGGNFMSGPGNTCVHGAQAPEYTEEQLKNIEEGFGKKGKERFLEGAAKIKRTIADNCAGRPQLSLPELSKQMTPGHIDEVYSMVKTGFGPCGEAVLLASPDLGMMLLKNSDESILPANFRGKPYEDEDRAHDAFVHVCKEVFKKQTHCKPEEISFKKLISELEKSKEYSFARSRLQNSLDELGQKLDQAYRKQGCGPLKIIRTPMIPLSYGARSSLDLREMNSTIARKSLLPSMTNLQQFGRKLQVPDPGPNAFREHLIRELKNSKVDVEFVNVDMAYHKNDGAVHCLTNVIRYCRPR